MGKKRIRTMLVAMGVVALMVMGSAMAFAAGPDPNQGSNWVDQTEVSAEIRASLITRLEASETFGNIPAGVVSTLADNSVQGPGVQDGAGVLQQTQGIDYNVSGNVEFDTKVYANDDFQGQNDTIPVAGRLAIQKLIGAPSYVTYQGTGSDNAIQVLDNEDPREAGDAGLTYSFGLRLDVPDDTLPGTYQTTLTFVTYQS